MRICRWCGQPLEQVQMVKGWAHALPLASFRVSPEEAAAIHRDPPRPGEPLHRPTLIHPAQPAPVFGWVPGSIETPQEATA